MLANPQTMLAIYTIYVYLVFGHYFSCCSLVMIIPICRYSRGIGIPLAPAPSLARVDDPSQASGGHPMKKILHQYQHSFRVITELQNRNSLHDHENSRRQSHPHLPESMSCELGDVRAAKPQKDLPQIRYVPRCLIPRKHDGQCSIHKWRMSTQLLWLLCQCARVSWSAPHFMKPVVDNSLP